MRRFLEITVTALLLGACGTDVATNNAYDPEGTGAKIPGHIEGDVFMSDASDASIAELVLLNGENQERARLVPGSAGHFQTQDLVPGVYHLQVVVPEPYVSAAALNIEVAPGMTAYVSLMINRKPDAAALSGAVKVTGDDASPAAIRVTATLKVTGQSWVQFADGAGEYLFAAMPPGDYAVRAERSDLTPAAAEVTASSNAGAATGVADLTLHPIGAVVRFVVPNPRVNGVAYTATSDVPLELLDFGGVTQMRVSANPGFVEDGVEIAWEDHRGSIVWSLSSGDGDKVVYAEFRAADGDGAILLASPRYQAHIILDSASPELTQIALTTPAVKEAGVHYIKDQSVLGFQLLITDVSSGVSGLRVAVSPQLIKDAAFDSLRGGPGAILQTLALPVDAAEGLYELHFQAADHAGNQSATTSVDVVRDTTPPATTGTSVVLAGGASATSSRTIIVNLAADDGASGLEEVALSNGGIDCETASYGPFLAERLWTLPDSDALHQVWACFRDAVGNVSSASASITLTRLGPVGSLTIGAGDPSWSASATVELVLDPDTAEQYALANETLDCSTALYQTLPLSSSTWTLLAEDGTRRVVVCLRDVAGNTGSAADIILLDTQKPTPPMLAINGGASVVADAVVSVGTQSTDVFVVQDMYLSNTGVFDGSDGVWQSYQPTLGGWDLAPGNHSGTVNRTLYARVRDAAGNVSETGQVMVSVDYDAPVLNGLSINDATTSAPLVSATTVQIYFDVLEANPAEVLISESSSFLGTGWVPYAAQNAFSLSPSSGSKVVFAKVRDAVGRESATQSVGTTLDIGAPEILDLSLSYSTWDDWDNTFNTVLAQIDVNVFDSYAGPSEIFYEIALGTQLDCLTAAYTNNFSSCTELPCATAVALDLTDSPVEGVWDYSICLRDAAGNATTAPYLGRVAFDESWPANVSQVIVVAESGQVVIHWDAATDRGPAGLSHYELEYYPSDDTANKTNIVFPGTGPYLIDGLEDFREYVFRVRTADYAGHISSYGSTVKATPGLRGGIVSENSGGATGYLRAQYVNGEAWIMSNEGLPSADLAIYRCDITLGDCRLPPEWSKVVLPGSWAGYGSPKVAVTQTVLFITNQEYTGSQGVHVVWTCSRSSDCHNAGNWTRVQLAAASALRLQSGAIAATATHVATSYVNGNVPANYEIWTCRLSTDCSVFGNWRSSNLTGTAFYSEPTSDIVAANGSFYAVRTNLPVFVSKCDTSTDCNSSADWATYSIPATGSGTGRSHNPQIVRAGDELYIFHTYRSSAGTSYSSRIAVCALASGCDEAIDWTASVSLNLYYGFNGRASLTYAGGKLQAAWHQSSIGRVSYASCDIAGGADCTAVSGWRKFPLPVETYTNQVPGVVSVGANPIVAYLTDGAEIFLSVPRVMAPTHVTVGPGYAELRVQWPRRLNVSGYEHVYDGDGGPLWDNRTTFSDALLVTNQLNAATALTYTAVQAYDVTGATSAYTATSSAKAFQQRSHGAAEYDYCVDTGTWCLQAAVAQADTRIFYAYGKDSTNSPTLEVCDTAVSDCGATTNWTEHSVAGVGNYDPTSLSIEGDTLLMGISYQNQFPSNPKSYGEGVAWCNLSTGCAFSSYTWNPTEDGWRQSQATLGGGRIWVVDAAPYSAGAGALRLHYCATSTDCTNGANWTKNLIIDAETSNLGHSMEFKDGRLIILRSSLSATKLYGCDLAATGCNSSTDFSVITIHGSPAYRSSLRHAFDDAGHMAYGAIRNGEVEFGICPMDVPACLTSSVNWAHTPLNETAKAQDGLGLDLTYHRDRWLMVFSNANRYVLGSCVQDCHLPSNWRFIDSVVPTDTADVMKTVENHRFLWATPDGEFGFARGRGTIFSGYNASAYMAVRGAMHWMP